MTARVYHHAGDEPITLAGDGDRVRQPGAWWAAVPDAELDELARAGTIHVYAPGALDVAGSRELEAAVAHAAELDEQARRQAEADELERARQLEEELAAEAERAAGVDEDLELPE